MVEKCAFSMHILYACLNRKCNTIVQTNSSVWALSGGDYLALPPNQLSSVILSFSGQEQSASSLSLSSATSHSDTEMTALWHKHVYQAFSPFLQPVLNVALRLPLLLICCGSVWSISVIQQPAADYWISCWSVYLHPHAGCEQLCTNKSKTKLKQVRIKVLSRTLAPEADSCSETILLSYKPVSCTSHQVILISIQSHILTHLLTANHLY